MKQKPGVEVMDDFSVKNVGGFLLCQRMLSTSFHQKFPQDRKKETVFGSCLLGISNEVFQEAP